MGCKDWLSTGLEDIASSLALFLSTTEDSCWEVNTGSLGEHPDWVVGLTPETIMKEVVISCFQIQYNKRSIVLSDMMQVQEALALTKIMLLSIISEVMITV